jgi:hypothetical protein
MWTRVKKKKLVAILISTSDGLKNLFLELPLNLLALVISRRFPVEVQQGTEIKLRGLKELDLADMDVLQGINSLSRLFNLAPNDLRDELRCELRERAANRLTLHDVGHLLSDGADLRRSGVCGLLDLVWTSLRKRDGEQADEIFIGSLNSDVRLDESLPLAHKRPQFVGSEVHAMEVGQTVLSLNLIHAKLDLAESVIFVVLKISERHFENPALQRIVGVLQTSRTVDEGLAHVASLESGRRLHRIFILTGERVNSPLLDALLALRQALVLSNSHDCDYGLSCNA